MRDVTKINNNIKVHNKIAENFEKRHDEIFNPVEQKRLERAVANAVQEIKSNSKNKLALDYGCGSGNLTKFLLKLNLTTVSADVSINFLKVLKANLSQSNEINVLLVDGLDLTAIKDNKFEFVAVYSILHHIPDYLRIVEEFVRVLKPGGVFYIDHENCPSFWDKSDNYREFLQLYTSRWKKYRNLLNPRWYLTKIRLLIDPKYQFEGDIHVFPDDHIDWDKIISILTTTGCEIIIKNDYLNFKSKYQMEHYNSFKNKCNDMRLMVAKKVR